jgi:small subunit ribosomal protein S16
MVKLRMKRTGRTHRPYYRIVAVDIRTRRDGNPIEEIGHYDPLEKDASKGLVINPERAQHWLSVGAQPSRTVASLLRKAGVTPAVAAK